MNYIKRTLEEKILEISRDYKLPFTDWTKASRQDDNA